MKKDLIIFDLDGTLINTDTLYTLGWKTILKGYGIALPEATLAQMNGQSTEKNNEIVNSYLNSWERTLEARNKREEFVMDAMEMGLLVMKPGARELLEQLKSAGRRMALATSSPSERAKGHIAELRLEHYFEFIIYGDQVSEKKPSPEMYTTVLEKLGVSPKNSVAIEDSPSGVQSALAAGLDVYLVTDRDTTEFAENPNVHILESLTGLEL